ncbi:MAG TPA: hypothetical protein VF755_13520 [Catenuloplanes sp.]|jgi:hypothetical protein
MDALDQLADPAVVLLARVDDVLSRFGAPAGHPVWQALRRLRVLPGAALAAVAALRPDQPAAMSAALHRCARGYADVAADLPTEVAWQGPAGSAYASRAGAFAAHLAGVPGGLADRLDATAGYTGALAGWQRETRQAVAGTLAVALRSGEAVVLSATASPAGPTGLAVAAAEIGRLVLDTVAAAYDRAEALLAEHAALADRAANAAASGGAGMIGGTLRIDG